MYRIATKAPMVLVTGALVAACAALPEPLGIAAFEESRPVAGSATELYTRIARGALTCWFGANGVLKSGYIYNAEAEPASRGGASEIDVRVREKPPANPRGVRAFHVAIKPKGEAGELEVTAHKIPKPLGAALKADVERWAAGEIGCQAGAPAAGWAPRDPNEAPPPPVKKKSAKRKA